jgi:SAM-dependent methyltransferase
VNAGPVRDLLWANLREIPAFRALIRTIEGRLLLEQGPLPRPLLDVGCGDGHFAGVVLGKVDVGIDVDLRALNHSWRRDVYRLLGAASAGRMPFRDGSFRSVLANCALEHMPDLDAVLREINRVLVPGGTFVFSVPNATHNRNLAVARLLDRFGLTSSAEAYREWFRRMQVHFHMYEAGEWYRRVEATGFEVTFQKDYLSPRATVLMELGHFAGWHNLIARALFGRWVLLPWRPLFFLTERLLAPRVVEDGVEGSSCIFLVARKVPVTADVERALPGSP